MICIVDYGMGNLRSVQKTFQRLNINIQISGDLKIIAAAEKLVFPGVGHFANGMKKLEETGIKDILNKRVLEDKVPILGICLGMQLMTRYSEEGGVEGLGWIEAQTNRFIFNSNKLKIPHMGWNRVQAEKNTTMSQNINSDDVFYFVHSYLVNCNDKNDILFKSIYGAEFDSGFEKENIVGVQFHPEKSYQSGMQLIKNFLLK